MLKDLTFHHIGYAVLSMEKSADIFFEMGYRLTPPIIDPIQNVKIAFVHKEGAPLIELVQGIDEKSPVAGIIAKVGSSPYHICYETPSIEESILELKKHRFLPLFKPVEAIAFENRKICYLFNKDVGLIELLSEK